MKVILVTGAAGFIGYHLSRLLLEKGYEVVGIDNMNDYYEARLKTGRVECLRGFENFCFETLDIADEVGLERVFREKRPNMVVNLAAQAGVRYSLENPAAYIASNLAGFASLLECCRRNSVQDVIYASSSSVYGARGLDAAFVESDATDKPESLYAATKKCNEILASAYAKSFGLLAVGLRFFTVYGPWGRPDMAYFKFARSILAGREIELYNPSVMWRDFTYIDDIVLNIGALVEKVVFERDWLIEKIGGLHAVMNIGNNKPRSLLDFVSILESACGKAARTRSLPMQPGDVPVTFANIDRLAAITGSVPSVDLEVGLPRFVTWLKEYDGA